MTELALLFERGPIKLKQEIINYTNPADLWKTKEGIRNSAGNLSLHLVGNLKHFIGKTLSGVPYERKREKEFSDKNVPAEELLKMINEKPATVKQTLLHLEERDLIMTFPIKSFSR